MYRYETLISQVQEWIATGSLKPGDRLPSVRTMAHQMGYSTVTVHHAYGMLEDEGILECRPRSGFFISKHTRRLPEFSAIPMDGDDLEIDNDPHFETDPAPPSTWRYEEFTSVGSLQISEDLVPDRELYRHFVANLRWEATRQDSIPWQGTDELREVVARRVGSVASRTNAKDVIITPNADASLSFCLDVLTKPGDKVLVETPMDAASVSAVLDRDLVLVEIYSHPRFGVDTEQFRYLLQCHDFACCILSPNNHSPTGVTYSTDVARGLVEAATERNVPIVENMVGQDLSYGAPSCELAKFDTRNIVLRFGGFADTLGPKFGLGWIAMHPRYHARAAPQHMMQRKLAGDWAIQRALADFLSRRSYEKHIRRQRETLAVRMRRGLSLVFQNFPESCTVSRPLGGYMCWVRGPKHFNALTAIKTERYDHLRLAPGPLFSVTRAFSNFIALNLSFPWTADREEEMATIGQALLDVQDGSATI